MPTEGYRGATCLCDYTPTMQLTKQPTNKLHHSMVSQYASLTKVSEVH